MNTANRRIKRMGTWCAAWAVSAAMPLVACAATGDEVLVADELDVEVVTLRSVDGRVIVELVGSERKPLTLTADTIVVSDEKGQASGCIVLEADGRVVVTEAPGEKPRVQIGLTTEPITASLAAQLKLKPECTLLVSDVVRGLPAEKAGVRKYDVIACVEGEREVTQDLLLSTVRTCKPGDPVQLRIIRGGEPIDVTVVAEPYQAEIKSIPILKQLPVLGDVFVQDDQRLEVTRNQVLIQPMELTIDPIVVQRLETVVSKAPSVRDQIAESLANLKEQIAILEALLEKLDQ